MTTATTTLPIRYIRTGEETNTTIPAQGLTRYAGETIDDTLAAIDADFHDFFDLGEPVEVIGGTDPRHLFDYDGLTETLTTIADILNVPMVGYDDAFTLSAIFDEYRAAAARAGLSNVTLTAVPVPAAA